MTGVLISVNFVFLLATAPMTIYLSTQSYWTEITETTEGRATLHIIWACLNIVAYTNYSINFALYCFSSPTFRQELLKMFRVLSCMFKVYPSKESTDCTDHNDNL